MPMYNLKLQILHFYPYQIPKPAKATPLHSDSAVHTADSSQCLTDLTNTCASIKTM